MPAANHPKDCITLDIILLLGLIPLLLFRLLLSASTRTRTHQYQPGLGFGLLVAYSLLKLAPLCFWFWFWFWFCLLMTIRVQLVFSPGPLLAGFADERKWRQVPSCHCTVRARGNRIFSEQYYVQASQESMGRSPPSALVLQYGTKVSSLRSTSTVLLLRAALLRSNY